MTKYLLMLSGVLMAFPESARDFDYTYEGQTVTYTQMYEISDEVMTKPGMGSQENSISGALILPSNPMDGNNKYTLTEIGDMSFSFCGDLTSVDIPNTVKYINSSAFEGCYGLTTIKIDKSLTSIWWGAFSNCPSISDIFYNATAPISSYDDIFDESVYATATLHVPEGTKEVYQNVTPWNLFNNIKDDIANPLGDGEFKYTYEGKTVIYKVIDAEAKTVMTCPGTRTVAGNAVAGDIVLPAQPKDGDVEYTLIEIGDYSFANCSYMTSIEIPNTVKTIGEWAFWNCNKLTSMVLPSSVNVIRDCAFYSCENMASINIPATVSYLGGSALCGCNSLTTVKLPTAITSISHNLFYGCEGLIKIDIPTNITSIESGAFIGCESLTTIEIPSSVTSIGRSIFDGCRNLQSVILPNTIKEIEERSFMNCRKLESIVIPASVERIGGSAFSNCNALTSIELPNSVKSIENYAFSYCENLSSVVLSSSLESIWDYAFAYSDAIKDIYYNTTTLVSASENIFDSSLYETATLHVRIGSQDTFQSMIPWNLFRHIDISLQASTTGREFEYTYEGQTITYTVIDENSKTVMTKEGKNAMTPGNLVSGTIVLPQNPKDGDIEYTLTEIGLYGFTSNDISSISIPNTVKSINQFAFYQCSNMTTLEIGSHVETIESCAFSGCSRLTNLAIPNSVITVGPSAFRECSSLNSVKIGESVQTIDVASFASCKSLTSLEIPASVTLIGARAFQGCESLMSINVSGSNTNYSSLDGILYDKEFTMLLTVPGALESVNIPSTVTEIGPDAMAYCNNLTTVKFPASVEIINDYALVSCSRLTSVTLPNSITSFGEGVFYDCESLKDIYYNTSAPVSAPENIFNNSIYSSATLHIPVGTKDSFASVIPWNSFNNIVDDLKPENEALEFQYTYEGQTITYTVIDPEAKTVKTKEGTPEDAANYVDGSLVLPANPMHENVEYTLTEIGKTSFLASKGLKSVIIPNTVETIGEYAFFYCDAMESLELGTSVREIESFAFAFCKQLTDLKIPNSVKSIASYAFSSCKNLKYVEIPSDIETIGYAFVGCDNIEEVYYNTSAPVSQPEDIFTNSTYSQATLHVPVGAKEVFQSVTPWNSFNNIVDDLNPETGEIEFEYTYEGQTITYTVIDPEAKTVRTKAGHKVSGDLILPDNPKYGDTEYTLTEIGDRSFSECKDLNSVVIPNTVIKIGNYALGGCFNLTSVSIGNAVEIIDTEAFSSCKNLTSIYIPNPVKTIGFGAFVGCQGLTSVTVGNSVQTIGDIAFLACRSLLTIDLPASVESIGYQAFYMCDALTAINVSEFNTVFTGIDGILYNKSVTELLRAPGAIENAIIPETVTVITSEAFTACRKLKSVDIPSTTTRIEQYAFRACNSLTSIEIPSSVEYIGEDAFYATGLTSVYYNTEEPIEALANVFDTDNYEKATLYVPESAIAKCKEIDPWKNFATISPYDFNGVEDVEIDGTGAIDFTSPYEVYNLNGLHVADTIDNLVNGIYIVRQGARVQKIAVK